MKNKQILPFIFFLCLISNTNNLFAATNKGAPTTSNNGLFSSIQQLVKQKKPKEPKNPKKTLTQSIVEEVFHTVQAECYKGDSLQLKQKVDDVADPLFEKLHSLSEGTLAQLADKAGKTVDHTFDRAEKLAGHTLDRSDLSVEKALAHVTTERRNALAQLGGQARKTINHLGMHVNRSRRAAVAQLGDETRKTIDYMSIEREAAINHASIRSTELVDHTADLIPEVTREVCTISRINLKKLADQVRTDVNIDLLSLIFCGFTAKKGIDALADNNLLTGAPFLIPTALVFYNKLREKNKMKINEEKNNLAIHVAHRKPEPGLFTRVIKKCESCRQNRTTQPIRYRPGNEPSFLHHMYHNMFKTAQPPIKIPSRSQPLVMRI